MEANHAVDRQLHLELLDLFPNPPALERMVSLLLRENLHIITTANGLAAQAFDLLQWAEASGRIADLQAAVEQAKREGPSFSMIFTVPHERNVLLVGREAELAQLAGQIQSEPTPAIVGTGGIGKTQLAVEFAYRIRKQFPGGIFWLTMDTPDNARSAVVASGGPLGLNLPGWDALDFESKIAAVQRAWQSPDARLLIFDNCEDGMLLHKWRPRTGGSRVLVTSRRANWSRTLNVAVQQLDVLSLEESIALLRKHRPDLPDTDSGLKAVAEELGCLPLALHLAGHFLDQFGASPETYLQELRSIYILKHRSLQQGDLSPTDHEQNVERTFLVSYNRLKPDTDPTDKLAVALLARAAYFAPGEPIPTDLLLLPTLQLPADDPDAEYQAKDALKRLTDLGLIEPVGSDAVRLHRLLAEFTRQQEADPTAQPAVEQAVGRVANYLNGQGYPTPMLAIQAHLRTVVDRVRTRTDEQAAWLCSIMGYYLHMIGDYSAAQSYLERALTIHEAALGPTHPDTAQSLNKQARLLTAQGDWATARPLYERALTITEAALGPSHPSTANILNNLAELLQAQGDYNTARPLYERALIIREQVNGPNDSQTANSLNKLALLLQAQGDYSAARPLYGRALAIREAVCGPNHPDTAISLSSLAFLLQVQGDYKGAHPLHERALAIAEATFGTDHPEIARNLNNLAVVLRQQGDYKSARSFYERALAICGKVFGPTHPYTATSLSNLAGVLEAQGDYTAARLHYERALQIRETSLGPIHPDTAASLNNLATFLYKKGDLDAARQLLERALAICNQRLGLQHPTTSQIQNNLAVVNHAISQKWKP